MTFGGLTDHENSVQDQEKITKCLNEKKVHHIFILTLQLFKHITTPLCMSESFKRESEVGRRGTHWERSLSLWT